MRNTKERFSIDGVIVDQSQYSSINSEHSRYAIYYCKESKKEIMKSKKQPHILWRVIGC